jgi:uncharacterized protein YciI
MAMFLVQLRRYGPQWNPSLKLADQADFPAHAAFVDSLVESGFIVLGGPLADEERVIYAVEASTEEDVRSTVVRDPWNESHLRLEWVEPWTVRLDGRSTHLGPRSAHR